MNFNSYLVNKQKWNYLSTEWGNTKNILCRDQEKKEFALLQAQ